MKTQTQRKDGHVKTEAEVGVMLPQVNGTSNFQNLEEARKGPLQKDSGSMVQQMP